MKRKIFFCHIMKTAGTSFRHLLENAVGPGLYPTTEELKNHKRGRYLETEELIHKITSAELNLSSRRVITGHYPYILIEKYFPEHFTACFLREPIARTISMIGNLKRDNQNFKHLSIKEVLSNQKFVNYQVKNYQTKVFAVSNLHDFSINSTELDIDESHYAVAKERLLSLDFIGLSERFNESLRLFSNNSGLILGSESAETRNVGQSQQVSEEEIEFIRNLVPYDLRLYQEACKKFINDLKTAKLI